MCFFLREERIRKKGRERGKDRKERDRRYKIVEIKGSEKGRYFERKIEKRMKEEKKKVKAGK